MTDNQGLKTSRYSVEPDDDDAIDSFIDDASPSAQRRQGGDER